MVPLDVNATPAINTRMLARVRAVPTSQPTIRGTFRLPLVALRFMVIGVLWSVEAVLYWWLLGGVASFSEVWSLLSKVEVGVGLSCLASPSSWVDLKSLVVVEVVLRSGEVLLK